jgi:hypothetical protein
LPNVVITLHREMSRVRALLPKMDPQRQREIEFVLSSADVHMAMNSLEGMMESISDLQAVQAEHKP